MWEVMQTELTHLEDHLVMGDWEPFAVTVTKGISVVWLKRLRRLHVNDPKMEESR